jgi:hypothetical protein
VLQVRARASTLGTLPPQEPLSSRRAPVDVVDGLHCAVCAFMQAKTNQIAAELELKDLCKQIEPYVHPILRYVKETPDEAPDYVTTS